MDSIEEFYFLENSALKVLLLNNLLQGRSEQVNKLFLLRPLYGEFYVLFEKLKKQPDKFYEYLRMSSKTFYCVLNEIKDEISKRSNFRACIPPEERLAVTLR